VAEGRPQSSRPGGARKFWRIFASILKCVVEIFGAEKKLTKIIQVLQYMGCFAQHN
jgi:hypothetical protein